MLLIKQIVTVGALTLLSRATGFTRDVLIANALGASWIADAFFVAFKLPNLFRHLFAEGAMSSIFIPLYVVSLQTDGVTKANDFARQVLTALSTILLIVTVLAEVTMPWIVLAFAPGFYVIPDKVDLAINLARITFPYLLFISIISLQSGLLNVLSHFAAVAATPILLNISMIVFLLGAPISKIQQAYALAWGVSISGILQLIWISAVCVKVGVPLIPTFPNLSTQVRTLLRRILPVTLGVGLYQLNLMIDTTLASLAPSGAVSFLYYADRINQLPLGVIGTAIGTTLLPLLSRQISAGRITSALVSQNRAIEFSLLLTVPAAVALIVLAVPIVSVLFEHGAFGLIEKEATAVTLSSFSLGLPAYVLGKILTPSFFARQDTVTPVKVAAISLCINTLLSIILMQPFSYVGIALASALSAWCNVMILASILYCRRQLRFDQQLKTRIPRLVLVSIIFGIGLESEKNLLLPWIDSVKLGDKIWAMTIIVLSGLLFFYVLARLSQIINLSDLKSTNYHTEI